MNTPTIIVQARTGSSRMPGKMLARFADNLPLLEVILRRVKNECPNIPIIVATTDTQSDILIVEMAKKLGIAHFCGNQDDVLARFIEAAQKFEVQNIIRLCADNPFIDTAAINNIAQLLGENPNKDYIAYCTSQKVPTIKTHYGFWAEGVTLDALKKIEKLTTEKLYREHVTNYIYAHAEQFDIMLIGIDSKIEKNQKLRLTVDTLDDFDNLKVLYKELAERKITLTPGNIVAFVDANPYFYTAMIDQIKRNSK